MLGFQELKRAIRDVEGVRFSLYDSFKPNLHQIDIENIPLPTLLAPFFAIIRSSLSTGPITSAALSALHTFFVCGLISQQSPSLDVALLELSSTVSRCKFEASDSSGDEVVLLKIMTVIHDCLCGRVGGGLGDIEVCEMLETVLTTCCQMRLSGECAFWHSGHRRNCRTEQKLSGGLRKIPCTLLLELFFPAYTP